MKIETNISKKLQSFVVDMLTFYVVFVGFKKPSANAKTGPMIQTYFLDKTRLHERSVFGSKCHQCTIVNDCYVSRDKLAVRNAMTKLLDGANTSYRFVTFEHALERLKGCDLRLGTYGDPSVLTLDQLQAIAGQAYMFTAYTHFWREIDTEYSKYFMASVESYVDRMFANKLGYRTFRVIRKDHNHSAYELVDSIECLYTQRGIQCIKCKLCNGTFKSAKIKDIWIHEH